MSIRQATVGDLDAISPLFDAYRVFYEERSDLDAAQAFLEENLLSRTKLGFPLRGRWTCRWICSAVSRLYVLSR
jgi:hypothetical protein